MSVAISNSITMDEAKERFLSSIVASNFSNSTVKLYIMSTHLFIKFLYHLNKIDSPSKIEPLHMKSFVRYVLRKKNARKETPLSSSTKSLIIRQVKLFCNYLIDEGYLLHDTQPFSDVKFPRTFLNKKILSESEVATVFSLINTETFVGYRDRTMFEILYTCGLRKSELCFLKLYDLNFEEKTIFVSQSKGRRDRVVPMGSVLEVFLSEYVAKVRPWFLSANHQEARLFLTERREAFTLGGIARLMEYYSQLSGIAFTAHSWRHTFATHMLKNGASIIYIQKILGHQDISTTECYTHIMPTDLQMIIKHHHPRNRKELGEEAIPVPVRFLAYDEKEAALRLQYPEIAKLTDSESGRKMLGRKLHHYRTSFPSEEERTFVALSQRVGISEKTLPRMEVGKTSRIENWVIISKVVNLLEN